MPTGASNIKMPRASGIVSSSTPGGRRTAGARAGRDAGRVDAGVPGRVAGVGAAGGGGTAAWPISAKRLRAATPAPQSDAAKMVIRRRMATLQPAPGAVQMRQGDPDEYPPRGSTVFQVF